MEELSLKDLNFDNSDGFKPFAASNEELEKLGEPGGKPSVDETKETTDSDDQKGQESVATDDNKETQVQEGKTPGGEESSNSSSPKLNETEKLYSNLATQFKTEGVLPGLENIEEIKSLADINEAINKEVASRLDKKQKAIDKAMNLGLPAKEISEQLDVINQFKAITPEFISAEDNKEFRMNLIAQDFVSKGYSAERAKSLAQRSFDLGTDVDDAKFALTGIINSETKRYQDLVQKAEDAEKKSIEDIKVFLDKEEEFIPGVKLNSQQKNDIYKQITTDVGNKENAFMQAQKKDPVGSRIKLETLFYLTKGFSDFSIFGANAATDTAKNIENLLRGTSFTDDGKVKTDVNDNNSTFTLKDLKDLSIE